MCCFLRMFLFGVIVAESCLSSYYAEAFNIEVKHYTTYRKQLDSMFGFSVAEYRDKSGRGWVIVGAPEAQTSQPNVYRGGAVYRCDVAIDDNCIPVEFDRRENNYIKNPNPPFNLIQIDNKTLQWFGASVSTSFQDGGPILACAPRYVFFSVSQSKKEPGHSTRQPLVGNRRDPVGTCWITNFITSSEFSPCRTRNFGYHRQGSCQAGLGTSVSRDGERIFIGAPGSWYWQGQLFSVRRRLESFPFVPPGNASFGVFQGQTYMQILDNRDKVIFTREGSPEEDDSYLGYSIASGDFVGNGDSGTAVGMPRGYGLHGKVVLFTSSMINQQNITGEQMGGYFGYTIACGDIDGDDLDDLIVGAPMYTIPENSEMNIETGRIYIFYGKGPEKYREFTTKDGESDRGRFGLSLAFLGDIDHDGYGDFVVGAPYGGAKGHGAIYIYHGSRGGALNQYSQAIHADDLSTPVNTFGFSIAGGLDLDGNLYPDIVVGSYASSTVMLFRSRPVIKIVAEDTYVEFGSTSKLISLDEKDCILSDTTHVACLPLKACIKYTGDGVLPSYNFNIQYILDLKKTKGPRLFFLEHEGRHILNHTITVDRDQQFCRMVRVYVTPSIRDKLTSLDAEIRMSLSEEHHPDNRTRDPQNHLRPVLATTSSRKDTLSIRKNCGLDNICTPDLQLAVMPNVNKYLLGSGNRLELDILVQNADEDAFEATYNLKLPLGVDYIKIERIDKSEIPVQCSAPKQLNNNTLKCDIGNPLPRGNLVHFNVLLQPVDVHDEKSSYEFEMNVNSTNSEPAHTIHDNIRHLSLEIWVKMELIIEGESKPKDLYYNRDNYTEVNITTDVEYGPAFIHNYTIRNHGPSRIEEAEVFLIWPAATLANDELIYLLEQPETLGPLTCASANANPLSLKLEQRRRPFSNYFTSDILHKHSIGANENFNIHTGYDHFQESPFDNSWRNSHTVDKTTSSSTNEKPSELYSSSEKGSEQVNVQTESTGRNSSVNDLPVRKTITRNEEIHFTTTRLSDNHHTNSNGDVGRKFYENDHTQTLIPETNLTINHNNTLADIEREVNKNMKLARQYYESREREIATKAHDEEQLILLKRHDRNELKPLSQQSINTHLTSHHSEKHDYKEKIFYASKNESNVSKGLMSDNQESLIASPNFAFHSHNTTSHAEIRELLNTMKHFTGMEVYQSQGRYFIQFLGRFRMRKNKPEYLEFKDGSVFPIQNAYGEEIYSANDAVNSNQFAKIKGEIILGEDGKTYGRINNYRFPIQGFRTYTEERAYNSNNDFSKGLASQKSNVPLESNNEKKFANRRLEADKKNEYQRITIAKREINSDETHKKDIERTIYSHDYGSYNDNHTIRRKRANDTNIKSVKMNDSQHRIRYNPNHSDLDENKHDKRRYGGLVQNSGASNLFNNKSQFKENERILSLCNAAKCISLRCTLGRLEKNEEASISVRYRIKGTTLNKIALDEPVKISTQLVTRVTKLPFIGKPAGEMMKSHEVYTNIEPTAGILLPDVIPLWVVVLSACAGTIILLFLIFLLYKCGFFKRNRPTDTPERQPLNRNEHFQQGDDNL